VAESPMKRRPMLPRGEACAARRGKRRAVRSDQALKGWMSAGVKKPSQRKGGALIQKTRVDYVMTSRREGSRRIANTQREGRASWGGKKRTTFQDLCRWARWLGSRNNTTGTRKDWRGILCCEGLKEGVAFLRVSVP